MYRLKFILILNMKEVNYLYSKYINNRATLTENIITNNLSRNKIVILKSIDHFSYNTDNKEKYTVHLYKRKSNNNIDEYIVCTRCDIYKILKNRRIVLKPGEKIAVDIECYSGKKVNSIDLLYSIIEEE